MFTGIVQGMGHIVAIRRPTPDFCSITTRLPAHISQDLNIGASIAHNGCCLTITQTSGDLADFDIMGETLAKTNLGQLKEGDTVNLERAARFGDEIGGHLMSGHITCTVPLIAIERDGLNQTNWFALPEAIAPYILPKGFVGLDGCSLTIGQVQADRFCVHLIPETLRQTCFGQRQIGDAINLEIDPQTQAIVDTVQRIMAQGRFA